MPNLTSIPVGAITLKLVNGQGPSGPPGGAGSGGGSMLGAPVYVQATDPAGTSPYLWFKTDAGTGAVLDILKG